MSGMSMMDPGHERIGTAERDAAIAALTAHREAGRLDSVDYEDRQVRASQAHTWADLVPLFADLPEPRPAKVTALTPYANPAGAPVQAGASAPAGPGAPLGQLGRYRDTIMALTPLLAVVLFFVTKQWLWFLAIPIMGIVLYGAQGKPRR